MTWDCHHGVVLSILVVAPFMSSWSEKVYSKKSGSGEVVRPECSTGETRGSMDEFSSVLPLSYSDTCV